MGVQTFYGKGPHPLLLADSLAESGKISGTHNCLYYHVICKAYMVLKLGHFEK
jgi:hypothetical protein